MGLLDFTNEIFANGVLQKFQS